MSLWQRYCIFVCGLFVMCIGICLIIVSGLGSSPISSVPYVLEFCYPFTLGECTFFINMCFIAGEIAILRRRFECIQLLQIPATLLFSLLIDLVMSVVRYIPTESYIAELAVLLAGCFMLAAGVALEVVGNVVMLAGEGIVNAIAIHWKLDFGYTKVGFDCFLVFVAFFIGYLYLGEILGIREGTLLSALLVGHIVRFLLRYFTFPDEKGHLHFRLPV